MKINKFHIYLADLNPRFGAEPGKVRPVVVIQTDLLNSVHPSTIICPITTKVIRKSSVLRVHLSKKEAGLKQDSDILVDQIRAIDNRRFIKHLGQITNTQKQALLQNLNVIVLE
jgi:mRNA interferase MazF